jgi:regulator of cell morphogenesis and NO signaling
MVRDIDANDAIGMTRCGDSVGGPIACMENDHNLVRQQLAALRQWTDHYSLPAGAGDDYRQLLERLADFDRNTIAHMHKEDRVLFPGALQAQKARRARD